jgi:1-aminocyclopropane-1-carboxylate deaminase/D-cysteine desulfhydrase-like pyridoxal-dependent ACC family enzyme
MHYPPDFHLPSPLEFVAHPVFERAGIELAIKRDDLIHPEVSGNKWRKLMYNVDDAISQGHSTVLTFGGAYSNHIYATAKACQLLGLKSVGIIRGDYFTNLSPTLTFAKACGMQLKCISKAQFDQRETVAFHTDLVKEWGAFYRIPEGGANPLGVKGCTEILKEVDWPFDTVVTACGTATTFAGLILGLKLGQSALGISVLKDGGSLEAFVESQVGKHRSDWQILHGYAGKGYAKVDDALRRFKLAFETETAIPLDFVYTAKMMQALLLEVERGRWTPGTRLLALHTGGLQGNDGFFF